MSLMEIFYGTKLVESALNKVKGRSKVSDQNIESGKKSKDKETSINHEEIDEIGKEHAIHFATDDSYCWASLYFNSKGKFIGFMPDGEQS